MRNTTSLFKRAFIKWAADECPRMGAALSYYAVFGLVPFLLFITAFFGILVKIAPQQSVFDELHMLLGEQAASAIQNIIGMNSPSLPVGIMASFVGFAALIFAASNIMVEVKTGIDKIWGIRIGRRGIIMFIRKRVLSAALILGIGFLFLVSTFVSTAVAAILRYLSMHAILPRLFLQSINFLVSFMVVAAMFGFLYKLLPDTKVEWQPVWIGALVSALLFSIGKLLLDFYIGHSRFQTIYGVGGSFLILLAWIYYSSQIFYFGAEIARAASEGSGLPS